MVVLGLTGQCNFSCRYCYASVHPSQAMPWEVARRAVDVAAAGREPFVLQFSGGEPLLNLPVLKQTADYVRQRAVPAVLQLQTNGSLITAAVATLIRTAGIGVGLSLDGRPAVHDEVRRYPDGSGTAASVRQGAACLADAGIAVGLTSVVTARNAEELPGVVEMAYYFGNVRKIGFDLLKARGSGAQVQPAAPAAVTAGLYAALTRAGMLAARTGIRLRFAQLDNAERQVLGKQPCFSHCHAITGEALFVAADGSLYPCPSLAGDGQFWLGNIMDGVRADRRRQVAAYCHQAMTVCFNCKLFLHCGGGCFARWYLADRQAAAAECALKKACIDWYKK